jgi:hypothetical protein
MQQNSNIAAQSYILAKRHDSRVANALRAFPARCAMTGKIAVTPARRLQERLVSAMRFLLIGRAPDVAHFAAMRANRFLSWTLPGRASEQCRTRADGRPSIVAAVFWCATFLRSRPRARAGSEHASLLPRHTTLPETPC